MITLNQKSKNLVKKITGLNSEQLSNMDFNQIDNHIEKKTNRKLKPMKDQNDKGLLGRGSAYLYLNRLLDIDIINKKISRI